MVVCRRSAGHPLLRRTASEVTLPGSGGSTPGVLSPSPSLLDVPPPHAAAAAAAAPVAEAAGSAEVATGPRQDTLDAAWDAYAQEAAFSRPGTLEAAWDACQQSASAAVSTVRRSFESLGLPPPPEHEAASHVAGEEGPSPGGSQRGASLDAGAAAARASAAQQDQRQVFPKSISTPVLTHASSSSFDLGLPRGLYLAPGAGSLDGGAAEAAGTSLAAVLQQQPTIPLGPGAEGGIASHAVALSPMHTLSQELPDELVEGLGLASTSSEARELFPSCQPGTLLREVSDAASSASAALGPEDGTQHGLSAGSTEPADNPSGNIQEQEATTLLDGLPAGTAGPGSASSHGEAVGAQLDQGSGAWATVLGWLGRSPSRSPRGESSEAGPSSSAGSGPDEPAAVAAVAAPGAEQQQGGLGSGTSGGQQGGQLQPHRLGSFTSSSMASSAASSPRTPTRGGLKDLPERRRR